MNPTILALADGTLFFVGLTLAGSAGLLLSRFHTASLRFILTIVVLIGVVLVVISSTLLSLWVHALWFIPAVRSLASGNLARPSRNLRIAAGVLLLLATAGLGWAEAQRRYLPKIVVPTGRTV